MEKLPTFAPHMEPVELTNALWACGKLEVVHDGTFERLIPILIKLCAVGCCLGFCVTCCINVAWCHHFAFSPVVLGMQCMRQLRYSAQKWWIGSHQDTADLLCGNKPVLPGAE